MTTLSLYHDGQLVELIVSAEDAERAQNDMQFAAKLLNAGLSETAAEEESIVSPEEESIVSPEDVDRGDGGSLYRWTTPSILLLLETYRSYESQFTDGRQPQKKVWDKVAEILNNNVTGMQCAAKLRSLKKTYKSIKDHNAKSGNDKRTWKFFDLMDEIFSKRAWCNPVAVASSSDTDVKPQDNTSAPSTSKPSTNVLMAKRLRQKDEHEEARAKRHKERLEMDHKFLAVLEKLANK
ncbi:uncharacterized protein LOC116169493 [Photinus pyralis]|uniref:uncharacterized protein LOC116159908 n=1 Tax=Photinus pyralis TaxID=7054 RepID=UPI0012670A2E|nr:uncharacterized protein LOC116159908 [Photinus pyralis]XP_031335273.1 uncharacterized protein LOC116165115 [Photinus pyralis]XP_031336061.1 uncharacterized protein LOC116165612 [Photinus pyralis]XP_031341463.1 uncharacterized protein LOC116169493 [Photinus pyralis]XP_031341464.1 uncharacterized protein LOC116169493 [Photinus pyralis]